MHFSVFSSRLAALTAGMFLLFAPALAQESETQNEGESAPKPLVVMELFTSQGCYSCPAADKLVDEVFTKNPNLLPLEMHVDYWDDLVYGFDGVWKDPFSARQFSERQFAYNRKMSGRSSGYTPQMIVQGASQASGSRLNSILKLVEEAAEIPAPDIKIEFSGDAENGFTAKIQGAVDDGMRIASAVFLRREITEVDSGENKGKVLVNANVVTRLVFTPAEKRAIQFPVLDHARQDCAAWVQRGRGFGPILAAARCPQS